METGWRPAARMVPCGSGTSFHERRAFSDSSRVTPGHPPFGSKSGTWRMSRKPRGNRKGRSSMKMRRQVQPGVEPLEARTLLSVAIESATRRTLCPEEDGVLEKVYAV